ncbi:MAG: putative 2-aminoethylphosphonate ABC transporter substrate-binding protein [Alphaproteobacteria bacterium]|nr:putative 2-aminoethylphosphonate ABC transporter substrate-binding protein [Alphaproteobacteria bacterium]
MKKIAAVLLAFALPLWLVAAPGDVRAQSRAKLVVYSTLETDQLGVYKKAFEADNPDIEIAWLKDSTGIITARILAEKGGGQADAVWGLAVTSMILLDEQGLLLPYAPKALAQIKPSFRDAKNPPSWVGVDAWVAALCFNTAEAAKRGLKPPRSWRDLLDPAWRGQLVMPNPASSGTGYFHVAAWIQMMGEQAAWDFMDGLDANMALYTHSGTKPCRMAANGEFTVGIAYELAGATARQQGAPIDTLLMQEGGGWDMDATAILKGTKNLALAQRLADWSASRPANEIYSQYLAVVAIEGVKSDIPFYPKGVEQSMIKNDFAWAAANRQRIIDEWRRRFDAKSEPK